MIISKPMAEYHEFIRFKKSDFFLKSVLKLSKLKKKTKLAGKILMALGWKKNKDFEKNRTKGHHERASFNLHC